MADTSEGTKVVGRHARYKAGQQVVVTWLAKTAEQYRDLTTYFQYLTKSKPSTRSGHVRVATHELIGLAQIIASGTPPTTVPEEIFSILEDAIAGRRAAHIWYSSQPKATDHESHVVFINALNSVRDILQPTRKIQADKPPTKAGKSKKNKKEIDSLANLFSCLQVQEPVAEPLGSGAKLQPSISKLPATFKLDDEQDSDEFALWCFLEDMNDVRTMVRNMWIQYRGGEVTLAVAGTVTEVAFGMIRRAYNDFIAICPYLNDWASIMNFLDLQIHINNNVVYVMPADEHRSAPPSTAQTKVADLLCTTATLLLNTYSRASMSYMLSTRDDANRKGFLGGKVGRIDYLRPLSNFESVLLSMLPDLLSLKMYSRAEYDPNGVWPARFFSKDGKNHIHADHSPTVFTDGLLESTVAANGLEKVEPPMWMSIVCAILMDIQDQVGSSPKHGGNAVLQTANNVKNIVDRVLKLHDGTLLKDFMAPQRRAELEKHRKIAAAFVEIIECGRNIDDPKKLAAMSKLTRMQDHKEKTLHPMLDVLPHTSGDSQYALQTRTFDIGVQAANDQWAILALAHFYKAAQRYGLVTTVWHDMDFIIAQHSTKKPFFTKTGTTTDAYAMLKHYLLDLGVDVSALLGKNIPRPPTKAVVTSKARRLSPAVSTFRSAMLARHTADEKLGVSRGPLIDVVLTAMTEQAQNATGAKGQQKRFTPTDLLATFQKEMISDEPRNNFDYISFASYCLDLLLRICHAGIRNVPKHEYKGLSTGYEFVYFLLKVAADAQASSRPVAKTCFGNAAAFMQEALATGDNAKKFSKAALDQSSGTIPKAKRPKFAVRDEQAEAALRTLSTMLPNASIGSSRQTIEIYDASGSIATFKRLLDTQTMAKLMPKGQNLTTYMVVFGNMDELKRDPEWRRKLAAAYDDKDVFDIAMKRSLQ